MYTASSTVVSCAAGPFPCPGSAQTPCSATVTGAGGLNETLTVSYDNNLSAGTATADKRHLESANHLGSSDSKTFVIGKANQVIAWSNPATISYGTALGGSQLNATLTHG